MTCIKLPLHPIVFSKNTTISTSTITFSTTLLHTFFLNSLMDECLPYQGDVYLHSFFCFRKKFRIRIHVSGIFNLL